MAAIVADVRAGRRRRRPRRRLESASWRRRVRRQTRPSPPAPARRPLAGLPRVLRAPGGELLDHHRPAHQRGLRLHLDAGQRAARRGSRPTSRWPSTCRARPSASRSTPSTRPSATRRPSEFSSQLPLIQRVLDALRIPHLELDGYEADDIIATLTTQALAEGMEVLILTGDRDSIQLVTETLDRALPDARASSDLARMTPGRRRGQVRRAARTATPSSRRSSARPPTTCPGVPGRRARASPRSGSTSTTASTTSSPAPTRSPARRARRCASTSAT